MNKLSIKYIKSVLSDYYIVPWTAYFWSIVLIPPRRHDLCDTCIKLVTWFIRNCAKPYPVRDEIYHSFMLIRSIMNFTRGQSTGAKFGTKNGHGCVHSSFLACPTLGTIHATEREKHGSAKFRYVTNSDIHLFTCTHKSHWFWVKVPTAGRLCFRINERSATARALMAFARKRDSKTVPWVNFTLRIGTTSLDVEKRFICRNLSLTLRPPVVASGAALCWWQNPKSPKRASKCVWCLNHNHTIHILI